MTFGYSVVLSILFTIAFYLIYYLIIYIIKKLKKGEFKIFRNYDIGIGATLYMFLSNFFYIKFSLYYFSAFIVMFALCVLSRLFPFDENQAENKE